MKLFNFFTTTALIVDANKVRTPEERQSKNELFLKKWFGNNCKGEEYRGQDDAVRPFRCQNKLDRYMIEWEKLQRNFAECGHFDLQAAVTGKNKGGRRRRNDDDEDEYESDWADYHNNQGNQGLFDNDLWDLTDEELAEIEREEKDGNGSADETDDYVSIDNTGTQISECTRNFVFIFLSHSRRWIWHTTIHSLSKQRVILSFHVCLKWMWSKFETKKESRTNHNYDAIATW